MEKKIAPDKDSRGNEKPRTKLRFIKIGDIFAINFRRKCLYLVKSLEK